MDCQFHNSMRLHLLDDLRERINELGLPVLLKVRRDAYDGRGNFKITSPDEVEKAYRHFDGKSLMVEKFVNFQDGSLCGGSQKYKR